MEGNKRIKLSHHSDLEFPLIGAGTFEIRKSDDILCAIRVGYRHFDLAESYENLNLVRKAFRTAFLPISNGGLGIERKTIFITMKVLYIRDQSHISELLKDLGLEYFDLLLYHTLKFHFIVEETMQKSWRTMISEKNSGKVLQIGVSNYYKHHLDRLLHFHFHLQTKLWSILMCSRHKLSISVNIGILKLSLTVPSDIHTPNGSLKNHTLLILL